MLPNIKPISTIPHSSNHSNVQSSVNTGVANTMPITTRVVGDIKNSNVVRQLIEHFDERIVSSQRLALPKQDGNWTKIAVLYSQNSLRSITE